MARGFRFGGAGGITKSNDYLIQDGVIKAAFYPYAKVPTAVGQPSLDQHTILDDQNGYTIVQDNGDQWQEYGSAYFNSLIDTSKYSKIPVVGHGVALSGSNIGIGISSDIPPNVLSGDRNYTTIQYSSYPSNIPTVDTLFELQINQTSGMVAVSIMTGYSRGTIGQIGAMYIKDVILVVR